MIGWLATVVWIGGIGEAYAFERVSGVGRASAMISAFCWPLGIGCCIVRMFYIPNRRRS